MSRFNLAFSLMSVIPLLTCCYLITVRFFSITILKGLNGIYFLMALIVALLGLLAGHELIRDMIKRLVDANTKLAQLNDQQAAFVGNVAHELRSPLAIFKGTMDNLADGLHGPLGPGQQEPLAVCQQEVHRLTRLVSDLLDLTRIEAGKMPLAQRPVVLQDILGTVVHAFSALAKERGLTLTVDLPEAPAIIQGDPDRLHQVFANLLGNAVKFTKVGGVHVQLTTVPDAVQVEVADTGPGIPQEDLGRIFDKFERVGDPLEEGAGLGLPIARDIVELHQGKVWVESALEHGSRFIVMLPVRRETP